MIAAILILAMSPESIANDWVVLRGRDLVFDRRSFYEWNPSTFYLVCPDSNSPNDGIFALEFFPRVFDKGSIVEIELKYNQIDDSVGPVMLKVEESPPLDHPPELHYFDCGQLDPNRSSMRVFVPIAERAEYSIRLDYGRDSITNIRMGAFKIRNISFRIHNAVTIPGSINRIRDIRIPAELCP